MKKIFLNLIIWLFEKYAENEWVDRVNKIEYERIQKENNLQKNELDEFLIDRDQRPLREAYEAGIDYGWGRAMEARGGNIY